MLEAFALLALGLGLGLIALAADAWPRRVPRFRPTSFDHAAVDGASIED